MMRVPAFFVIVAIVIWFGYGQEIWALDFPIDDYYFLLRSESMTMGGSHYAAIKEPLYPLFMRLPQALGLNLRLFQTLAYGASLFVLCQQVEHLASSRVVAWLTVAPLTLFAYQHPVLNRTTYDALQLALTPLTFAAAIHLYLRRADPLSCLLNGGLVSLHALNRPEGILFILPPLAALLLVRGKGSLRQAALMAAIPFIALQGLSALNYRSFGFWATTSIQSRHFQACLKDLMAIRTPPNGVSRYVPVAREAWELAYGVSPSFAKAKPYFDRNLGDQGWGRARYREPERQQGNILGGHTQWALLEGAVTVVGEDTRSLDAFFLQVSQDLEAAFADGRLARRPVLTTVLGPSYSPFSRDLLSSATLVGKRMLNMVPPPRPETSEPSSSARANFDFDRLALRRVAWVRSPSRAPEPQNAVTAVVFGAMAAFIPLALALLLAMGLLHLKGLRLFGGRDAEALRLIAASALALVLARGFLFASIDSCMYLGLEPRYMAAGAFAMWTLTSFTLAMGLRRLQAWRSGAAA